MSMSKPVRPGGGRRVGLMLVIVVLATALWYGWQVPELRHRLIYGFEHWVAGLQTRFNIRPPGAEPEPTAGEVELLKPPAALRPGTAPAAAAQAPATQGVRDPSITDDEALLSGAQPMPTLAAPRSLKFAVGEEVVFGLELLPGIAARGQRVIIGGLPMDASLSAGARDEMGRWVLDAVALPGLKLRSGAPGHYTLLIRTQPLQRLRVPRPVAEAAVEVTVLPAAGAEARAAAPPAAKPPQPGPGELLDRGRRALELGDLGAARLYLEAAAGQNSADAALLLAASYDPGRSGDNADVGLAADWYLRARKLGAAEAQPAIDALRSWLQARTEPGEAERKALAKLSEPAPGH